MGAGSYKAAHPPHPPLPPHTPRNDAWEQGAMRRRMLAGLKEVGQAGRAQGNIDLFRMQGAMRRQVLAVLKGGKQCILIPSPHDGAAVIHKCMVKGDGRGQTVSSRENQVCGAGRAVQRGEEGRGAGGAGRVGGAGRAGGEGRARGVGSSGYVSGGTRLWQEGQVEREASGV
ncbi:unnamed protein product [Closterium sp. NIES-65]|nr:unnamed protein product [Closterium sp. NIES-65]